ncbi:MAG: hypothetical protein HXY21_12820, partial [Parvularculaceae bacterium]|nr:hypothetical protein [Parvularculaceae bacterium]
MALLVHGPAAVDIDLNPATIDFGGLFTDPIISSSSTLLVIGQSPASANYVWYISGAGFTYDGGGRLTGGTVTGIRTEDSALIDLELTGGAYAATAVQALIDASDAVGLLTLLLSGDDTIIGGSFDDYLVGLDGFDQLFGDGGADTLIGGAQSDYFRGGAGADSIDG